MARIAPIPEDKLTAAQRRLRDAIAAQRSVNTVSGPFGILLHTPELGEHVAAFVHHFLSDTRVPHNLKELAILAIARRYTAQYEWVVHEVRARKANVAHEVIEAIRNRERPDFADPSEALVYDIANEIFDARRLSDDHYTRAVEALGETAVIELITLIGFYTAVAILLVSYQVEPPVRDGASPMPE